MVTTFRIAKQHQTNGGVKTIVHARFVIYVININLYTCCRSLKFQCTLLFSLLQEIDGDRIDKASAYILFFEREGLNAEEYLPPVDTSSAKIELGDLDDELEMDFKKQCAVM